LSIWLLFGGLIGTIFTIVILYLLIKEIKKVIRESSNGKVSNRCDLD